MPLSSDPAVNKTAEDLDTTLGSIFGAHPGYRRAHAKGTILSGTFTPSSQAAKLTTAPHFQSPTPILARFSNSTGIPHIPDNDANANPRGLAIRFQLQPGADGKRRHTDIVAHSSPFFPMKDGEGALAFFKSLTDGSVGDFLGKNPSAAAFVQDPKPAPESFATERFFSVTAFKFVDGEGKETFFRYQIRPVAGEKHLPEEEAKGRSPDFLFEDLPSRLPVEFKLIAQIAGPDDPTDDNTVHWPEDREKVELGTVKIERELPAEENAKEQQYIIFDPIPRGVQGLEASKDPLLDVRAALYLIGGKRRRGEEPAE